MEASSPLAAIHRPAPLFGRADMFRPHPHTQFLAPRPPAFNLRERFEAVQRNPDYFYVKPVRGSSPTASLAADLSQNFRIDNDFRLDSTERQSPRCVHANPTSPSFPTPRRALFTSNLMTAMEGRGKMLASDASIARFRLCAKTGRVWQVL